LFLSRTLVRSKVCIDGGLSMGEGCATQDEWFRTNAIAINKKLSDADFSH